MKSKNKVSFDYKWVIIGLCFLMVLVCLGFCSSNRSLYLAPITESLDLKRSHFSITDSIRFISTAIVNIFFGRLVAKYGTKKLIVAGFICLILSSLICSVASSLIGFYLSGALLGVGFSWTTTTMVGCVVNRWCREKKGTIMGAVLAANGIGAAVAAQILSPIIFRENMPFGYRDAYLLTAMLLGITMLLIILFYKDKDETEKDNIPQGKNDKKRCTAKIGKMPATDRVYLYLILICIFFAGMTLQGITGIAAAHMKDNGLSADFVATTLSICSLMLAASKFIVGFLNDKLGIKFTATMCYIASIAAMIALVFISGSVFDPAFAIIYAVSAAMALPLETIMLPIFALDLFGSNSYEQVLGIFVSVNTAGYAVGVPMMNCVFDIAGSYKSALLIMSAIMVLIIVIFHIVLNLSKKMRIEI